MIGLNKYSLSLLLALSIGPATLATDVWSQEQAGTNIPTVGQPRDISPKPYIPRGGIQLPLKPLSQDAKSTDSIDQDKDLISLPLTKGTYIEATLGEPDPAGIGINSMGQYEAAALWGEKTREDIITLLMGLDRPVSSAALEAKLRVSLSAPIPLMRSENDDETSWLMQARLQAMLALRDFDGFMALTKSLAKDVAWQNLTLYRIEEALASGRMHDACSAANADSFETDFKWLKLKSFCKAVEGDRMAVDFQLSLLEEIETPSTAFYQLIDQILIEAETGVDRTVMNGNTRLQINELPVSVLEVIMARVVGAEVLSISDQKANPLAVPLLLSQPGLSREAGVELIGLALKKNWISHQDFAAFVAANDADLENVTDFNSFLYDLALIKAIQDEQSNSFDRIEALNSARNRGEQLGYGKTLYDFYFDFVQKTVPATELVNHVQLFVEVSLSLGDIETAKNWYLTARSLPAGTSALADEALIALWPYMQLFNDSKGPLDQRTLYQWWLSKNNDPLKYQKASALFTTLDAMGQTVPFEAWGWLEDGPVISDTRAISTAHWRRFLIAAESDARMDLYAALASIFATDQQLDPTVVGSILSTLNELGEDDLAQAIALETVLKAGL